MHRHMLQKTVCFFCVTPEPEVLERNEFYAVDIDIIKDLGYQVKLCTSPLRIPNADLYFVWWWTWAAMPLLRAKLSRKPIVIVGTFDHVMQDGNLECYPHRPIWHQWLIRSALKHADANLVVSRDQEDYLRSHFDVKGLGCIPHVVDTEIYCPGDKPRNKMLVTFCWMNKGNALRKCIAESIRAMAKLHIEFPEHVLYICGEKGDDYPPLYDLVEHLKASNYIKFLGAVSKDKKIELMRECAIYLQPTHAEGFGVAILEAMSCGATVITSPVGAVPEVAGDTVMMVDGTNPDQIAEMAKQLLKDPKKRSELGQKARSRAAKLFSYARRKREMKAVLYALLDPS